MSKFKVLAVKKLCEEIQNPLYKEYADYVNVALAKESKQIMDFDTWRMQNDEEYRDEVLDSDPSYDDVPADSTDQERFDDKLDMYDIAGING